MGREARISADKCAAIALVLEKVTFRKASWLRKDTIIGVKYSPPLSDGKRYYIAHMICPGPTNVFVGGFLMTGEEDLETLQARANNAEDTLLSKLGEELVPEGVPAPEEVPNT